MEDLQNLIDLGVQIESVTCDGLSNIIKAVRKSSPETIIQRCVVHIQREVLNWLTHKPKSQAGVKLRQIARHLHLIKNRNDWGYWVVGLIKWYETHKSVRHAFIYIKRVLPDIFHYLDNSKIYQWTGIFLWTLETKHQHTSRTLKRTLQELHQVVSVLQK